MDALFICHVRVSTFGADAVPEDDPEYPGDREGDVDAAYASEGKFHRTWFWSYCV